MDEHWTTHRRYRDFQDMHLTLKNQVSDMNGGGGGSGVVPSSRVSGAVPPSRMSGAVLPSEWSEGVQSYCHIFVILMTYVHTHLSSE